MDFERRLPARGDVARARKRGRLTTTENKASAKPARSKDKPSRDVLAAIFFTH